jgi:hypothetical protein
MEMGCNLFNFTNTTVASKYIWLKVILGLNFYCRSHFNARPCPALAPPVLENFLTQRRKGAETQSVHLKIPAFFLRLCILAALR